MEPGSIVIVHLSSPTEKFWGVLVELGGLGLQIRGLNLGSFEDWMAEAAKGETPSIGLATMFVPMRRVDRIFLDEQVGGVESYCQRFEKRVGKSVESFLVSTIE